MNLFMAIAPFLLAFSLACQIWLHGYCILTTISMHGYYILTITNMACYICGVSVVHRYWRIKADCDVNNKKR